MMMNLVTAYLKSPLGILKLTCLFAIALVVALSTYTHFNSHWVYHSRMVDREEVSSFNISARDKLTEFRNEYEECRYNSRLYTGISLIDSPEKVNGFGARQYDSTPENVCPHPVMELFLVVTSIFILIVSLISLVAISIWLPVMVSQERSIKFYRILDLVLFCLATVFLFVSVVMFWYSTDNIWEWCSLKTSMVAFTFKPGGGGAGRSGNVGGGGGGKSGGPNGKRSLKQLQHDDTVDIITGSEENIPVRVQAYQVPAENNQVPFSQYSGVSRNTILIPTGGPPAVLYLTRVKRESPEIEVRFVESNKNSPSSRSLSAFDIELQKIRQDQYMDLCNVRQMTYEKYFTIAAAIIALVLHLVVIVLIYKKCGKGVVHDLQAHDEEVQRHPNEEDLSNNNNRPKSGQEVRPKSGQEVGPNHKDNQNDGDVHSDSYKSDASHAKNDNSMDNRSPNGRRTSQPNDEVARRNENGQGNASTQPHHHHHHHEADHKPKTQGIDQASGPSHT